MKTSSSKEDQLQLLKNIRESWPEFFENGSTYSRTVVTNYNDAVFCAQKGDDESASYFTGLLLESINQAEGRIHSGVNSTIRGEMRRNDRIASKVDDIWERMNDSEKFGTPMGLLPSWVLEYELTHEETVELMSKQSSKRANETMGYEEDLVGDDSMNEEEETVPVAGMEASLWSNAASEMEREEASHVFETALIEAEPIWEFISMATSLSEYQGRKALVEDRLVALGGSRKKVEAQFDRQAVSLIPNYGPEKFDVLDYPIAEDTDGFWWIVEEFKYLDNPVRYEMVSGPFQSRLHAEHFNQSGEFLKGASKKAVIVADAVPGLRFEDEEGGDSTLLMVKPLGEYSFKIIYEHDEGGLRDAVLPGSFQLVEASRKASKKSKFARISSAPADQAEEMLKGATEEELRLMLAMAIAQSEEGDAQARQVEIWIRAEMRSRGLEHRSKKTAAEWKVNSTQPGGDSQRLVLGFEGADYHITVRPNNDSDGTWRWSVVKDGNPAVKGDVSSEAEAKSAAIAEYESRSGKTAYSKKADASGFSIPDPISFRAGVALRRLEDLGVNNPDSNLVHQIINEQNYLDIDGVVAEYRRRAKAQGREYSKKTSSQRYDIAKKVVETKTAGELPGGILLDLFTASALVQVYEALSPENQAKFDEIPLDKLVAFVFSHVSVKKKAAPGQYGGGEVPDDLVRAMNNRQWGGKGTVNKGKQRSRTDVDGGSYVLDGVTITGDYGESGTIYSYENGWAMEFGDGAVLFIERDGNGGYTLDSYGDKQSLDKYMGKKKTAGQIKVNGDPASTYPVLDRGGVAYSLWEHTGGGGFAQCNFCGASQERSLDDAVDFWMQNHAKSCPERDLGRTTMWAITGDPKWKD